MAASASPKATTSRFDPAGSRCGGRRATTTSTSAPVAIRSSTVPAGPRTGNRPLATAAPTCTDTTPPSTNSTGTTWDSEEALVGCTGGQPAKPSDGSSGPGTLEDEQGVLDLRAAEILAEAAVAADHAVARHDVRRSTRRARGRPRPAARERAVPAG